MDLISVSPALLIIQALLLTSILLWIYCLVDILLNKFENNEKLIWVIVVIGLPFLGSLFYLFIGKKRKIKLD